MLESIRSMIFVQSLILTDQALFVKLFKVELRSHWYFAIKITYCYVNDFSHALKNFNKFRR